ncbi:MAG: hypothetical protein KDE23_19085 [Caldilinea sp.]|nr:hypothetical protein [Caldilinea sp.]
MTGKAVCYHHGGKTPGGMALPQYKTGRYSKYLPERLRERYSAGLEDGDLLALNNEVALVDARLADLLGRVDSGESGEAWKLAQAAWQAVKLARTNGRKDAELAAELQLEQVIERGLGDALAWNELGVLLDRRERLVRSERRRLVEMQQTMTVEQAMLLMGAMAALVDEHVTDRAAKAAISDGIRRLMSVSGGQAGAEGEADD